MHLDCGATVPQRDRLLRRGAKFTAIRPGGTRRASHFPSLSRDCTSRRINCFASSPDSILPTCSGGIDVIILAVTSRLSPKGTPGCKRASVSLSSNDLNASPPRAQLRGGARSLMRQALPPCNTASGNGSSRHLSHLWLRGPSDPCGKLPALPRVFPHRTTGQP